jgi:molybdopterin-binding protein
MWIRICGHTMTLVPMLRISEVASLLGVSDDTVRRWVEGGRLVGTRDAAGVTVVRGEDVAALAPELATAPDPGGAAVPSARNRMRGIVTRVVRDTVMAQVEIQAGPFRLVSLLSREAVDELGLEVGCPATAVVKATNVGVEVSG